MKLNKINIHCKQIGINSFFIHATSNKVMVEPHILSSFLFHWHKDSFYGTTLEIAEVNGRLGFVLNSYEWLELLSRCPFNSFVEFEWDEISAICRLLSGDLYEMISDVERAHKYMSLKFPKISDEIKESFSPDLWSKTIRTSFKSENQTVEEFTIDWIKNSILEMPLYKRQAEFVETLKEKGLETSRISDFLGVQKINPKINERPFTVGVKLVEPNVDLNEMIDEWKVVVFLRGKRKGSKMIEWSDRSKTPESWKDYFVDVEEEIASWKFLYPWLSKQISESNAWRFLTEVAEVLYLLDVEVLLPEWWKTMQNAKMKVKAKVSNRSESFVGLDALIDFNWQIAIDDKQLSESEFQKLVDENRKFIFIQGKWVRLDDKFMHQIQKMMKEAEENGLTLYDFLQQELPYSEDEDESEYLQIKFEVNNTLDKFVHQLKDVSEVPLVMVPQSFQGELRQYQVQGFSWLLFLRDHQLGGCLADDMGLGKTIQVIAYLLALQEKGKLDTPSLIVCPTSVLGNWQNELARFAPSLKVDLHYGTGRKQGEDFYKEIQGNHVVLTSYGILQQDEEEFSSIGWNAIVLDEAQNIKNANTKQSKAARRLKGQHHISVTGTPIENRLSELWSIFDFTIKGYLGTLTHFDKTFASPIERAGDVKKKVQLQKLIQPFLLRRSKKDEDIALNLPDKLEQKEYTSLSTEQTVLYQNIVQDTMQKVSTTEGFERKGLILKMLSKLKQLCDHPALFLKEEDATDILERSGKTEKLIELLDVIIEKNESVLIFTQFLGMGDLIQQLIQERYGINVPFLQGSTTKQNRDKLVEDFQNEEFPILLLSLKAGGTGLNLTTANHVIHFDRWWNPAVENQATDRAHRIGQKKFVHVHKLIASGTLEEKIDLMLDKKQTLNEDIIQSDNWITELSTSELSELIALNI